MSQPPPSHKNFATDVHSRFLRRGVSRAEAQSDEFEDLDLLLTVLNMHYESASFTDA